jgi:ribosomal protein S18 acetylase RimI-like enzyme
MDILPPTKEDIREIEQVLYKAWLNTYPNEELNITVDDIKYRFKDNFTEEALTKRWKKMVSDQTTRVLVAKDNGRVIGFIKTVVNPEKNQLQAIYLLSEYQGKGIGNLLWEEGKKILDPKKNTIVHVVTYNKAAIRFYEKLGFKDTGKRWTDERFTMRNGAVMPEMEMEIKANDVS